MMTMLLKSILIFIFVVISISDWRTHKIPDRWNAGILLVAVLLALVDSSVSWQERILGMFAVSVPMACLLFFVPGSFGGGDIKFVAAVLFVDFILALFFNIVNIIFSFYIFYFIIICLFISLCLFYSFIVLCKNQKAVYQCFF